MVYAKSIFKVGCVMYCVSTIFGQRFRQFVAKKVTLFGLPKTTKDALFVRKISHFPSSYAFAKLK
jgi:hypothetical protein